MDEIEKAEQDFQKAKPKSKKLLIISLLVIVIIVALGGVYFFLNSPKKLFNKNLDRADKMLEDVFSKAFMPLEFVLDENKAYESRIGLSGSIETNKGSEYEEIIKEIDKILKNEKINLTTKLDQNQEKLYAYFDLEEDGKTAIAGEAFVDKNIVAGKLKEINNKLFYVNRSDIEKEQPEINKMIDTILKPSYNKEYYEHLKNTYSKVIKDSIKSEQYTKSSTTIQIDGKDTKCVKTSLEMSKEQTREILIKLLETLKNDNKTIDLIVNSSIDTYSTPGEIKEEFIQSIDDAIEELKKSEIGFSVKLDLYNKGKEIVFAELNIVVNYMESSYSYSLRKTEKVEKEASLKISVDCADKNNVKTVFEIAEKDSQMSYKFTLDVVTNGNTNTITLDFGKIINAKLVIVNEIINNNEEKGSIKAEYMGKELLNIDFNTKYLKNTKNELETENTIVFNVNTEMITMSSDKISATLNLNTYVANIESIDIPTPSSSDINVLEDEIPNDFITKLQTKLSNLKVVKNIMELEKKMNPVSEKNDYSTDLISPEDYEPLSPVIDMPMSPDVDWDYDNSLDV